MIDNVTNGRVDTSKTTYQLGKSEHCDKNTQGSSLESKKDCGDKVTIGVEKDKEVTYNRPMDVTQSITLRLQVTQQIVTNLAVEQGAVGTVSDDDNKNQAVNDLVANFFKKLGLSTQIDVGDGKTADLQSMTPEEAQKLVADDGYWGVDKTSSRIADFAIAQVGDDLSRLDKVKDAIMKGFNSAKDALGGQLPDISQKTIDAVMQKLDKHFSPDAAESKKTEKE